MAATTAVRRRRHSTSQRTAAKRNEVQSREIMGLGLVGLGSFLGMTLFMGISVGPLGNGLETIVRLAIGRGVALAPLALMPPGSASSSAGRSSSGAPSTSVSARSPEPCYSPSRRGASGSTVGCAPAGSTRR